MSSALHGPGYIVSTIGIGLVGLSIFATLISAVSGEQRLRLIRLHRPHRPPRPAVRPTTISHRI